MDTQTRFQKHLEKLGDAKAAQQLGWPERTVKSWRLGERLPRPAAARAIVARLPKLTLADIYGR